MAEAENPVVHPESTAGILPLPYKQDIAIASCEGADVRAADAAIRKPADIARTRQATVNPEAIDNLDGNSEARRWRHGSSRRSRVWNETGTGPRGAEANYSRASNADALPPVITGDANARFHAEKSPAHTRRSIRRHAILDGSDALMLSGETAAGIYPLQSEMMDRIICETEASVTQPYCRLALAKPRISEAVAEAICHAAEELRMKAIVVFTETGYSARLVSKYRPRAPIMHVLPNSGNAPPLEASSGELKPMADRTDQAYVSTSDSDTTRRKDWQRKTTKAGTTVGIAGTPAEPKTAADTTHADRGSGVASRISGCLMNPRDGFTVQVFPNKRRAASRARAVRPARSGRISRGGASVPLPRAKCVSPAPPESFPRRD